MGRNYLSGFFIVAVAFLYVSVGFTGGSNNESLQAGIYNNTHDSFLIKDTQTQQNNGYAYGIYYLLSSISQGLAAILAITFTIVIVGVQIASKYSLYVLDAFFRREIKFLLVLFIFAIFIPLIALMHPNYYLVIISMTLGGVCLFSMIPFFFYLKNNFNPSILIEKNHEDIRKKIDGWNSSGVMDKIMAISGISRIGILEEDYISYKSGVNILRNSAVQYVKAKMQGRYPWKFPDDEHGIKSWQTYEFKDEKKNMNIFFEIKIFKQFFNLFDISHFKSVTPYQSTTEIIKTIEKIGKTAIQEHDHILIREVFGVLAELGMRGGVVQIDARIGNKAFVSIKNLIEELQKEGVKTQEDENKMKEIELSILIGLKDAFVFGTRCYMGPGIPVKYERTHKQYFLGEDFRVFLKKNNPEQILEFTLDMENRDRAWTDSNSPNYGYFGRNPKDNFELFYRFCFEQSTL